MKNIEQVGIRLAALILTALAGLVMIVMAAPAGIVGVVHDAIKSPGIRRKPLTDSHPERSQWIRPAVRDSAAICGYASAS